MGKGVITCSILASIVTIFAKSCDNTHKYCANAWKMCSPERPIFASIVSILVSLEGIMKRISVNINFRSQFWSNDPTIRFKIDQICFKTYKYCDNTRNYYTCKWMHFLSIGSILVSIITILTEYCLNTSKYWAVNYNLE